MSGTQIVIPQDFTGPEVAGLPVLVHGLPYAPSHRWLPYASAAAAGSKIASLKDLAGLAPLTQSDTAKQPTIEGTAGLPYALFSGAADASLTSSITAPNAGASIALVFRARSTPNLEYLARYAGQNIAIDGSGKIISANLSAGIAAGTAKRAVIVSFSAAGSILSVSGDTVRTGAGVTPTTDASVFLALAPNTRDFEIYEFALFDTALTGAQVSALRTALEAVWEI